jgi:cell wall assembly regulator SMI1
MNPILPPGSGPGGTQPAPQLPPLAKFKASCTDRLGNTAEIDILAPNSLGAVCRVAAFLADNLLDTSKVVVERIEESRIVPANIIRR